jgi:hypothetical protein
MASKYNRVTPIGYFTGKVMIGGHYIPKAKEMTDNEKFVQGLIRGHGLPPDRALRDFMLKLKSIVKNLTCTMYR